MKKFLMRSIVLLALLSISIIAVVSFTSRLEATLNNGNWVYYKGDIIGCGGSGNQCVWGTVNPGTEPDN